MQQLFLETKGKFEESLSPNLRDSQKLISKSEALFNIHFPKNQDLLAKAEFRLKFEELFYIQLQLILKILFINQKLRDSLLLKLAIILTPFTPSIYPLN